MATEVDNPISISLMDPAASMPPPSAPAQPKSAGLTPNKSTPSPSASSASGPRRPPRKSTLTQQQKNQKRQRATQDQLATLEMEFNRNPTPTGVDRDRIAEIINMTERSVQIWFQNRRAKIKLMAKKSLETGEDIDAIPESMRNYLALQAMESGKGLGGAFLGRAGLVPFGGQMLGGDNGQGKVLIHHLTCQSLSIGKWMRVGQNTMDLIVFYSPDKCTMTYYINNDQAGYKIEYPFSYIKTIMLENCEGDPGKPGGIVVELTRPPLFFMDTSPTNGYIHVGDFTEDQQASQCLVHRLGGNPKVLSGQLAKLVSLESFAHRHAAQVNNPFDMPTIPASAPVSPTNRPSSQPNFCQPAVGAMRDSPWGLHSGAARAGMPGPGHKRQRSRSVPMAVDFSMLQTPMPAFYIQQPGDTQAQPHSPDIFAPVPQTPHSIAAMGPNLRIDTQSGFGLDMRQYPLSATTAHSPADFPPSPGFYSPAAATTPLPQSTFGGAYGGDFLSPLMPATTGPQAMSPLSFVGAGDPAIVEHSPPMSMLGRSPSADMYAVNGDLSSAISDDGTGLGDLYSKHQITLPMHPHSPAFVDPQGAEIDLSSLVRFDQIDPASLSPESIGHKAEPPSLG